MATADAHCVRTAWSVIGTAAGKSQLTLIVLLAASLVVTRLILLWGGIDSISYDEELTTGLIAKDLIEGLRQPFFDYQLADHHAGTLLMGLLTVPVFVAFGQSLFALKLVPLFVYAVTMLSWFRCCDRYANRRVAVIVALLFIFSPQLLTRFSLITVGYHSESIVFTAAAAYIMFRILLDGKRGAVWFAGFGIVCGFGSWFAYIFLPTLATCLVFWALCDRRFMITRGFALFVAGFVVGGIPWIYFNMFHAWGGWSFLLGEGSGVSLTGFVARLLQFLTVDLYRSFATADYTPTQGTALSVLYSSAAAVSYITALALHGRGLLRALLALVRPSPDVSVTRVRPEVWFLLYPLLLATFYAMSTRIVGHDGYEGFRYLVPLYPILFVLIALGLDQALKTGGILRWIGIVGAMALLSAGVGTTLEMLSFDNVGRALLYKPYSYREFGIARGARPPLDLRGMSDDNRRYYLLGRGWYLGLQLDRQARVELNVDSAVSMVVRERRAASQVLLEAHRNGSIRQPITTNGVVLPPGSDDDANAHHFFFRVLGSTLSDRSTRQLGIKAGLPAAASTIGKLGLPPPDVIPVYAGLSFVLDPDNIPYYRYDLTMQSYLTGASAVVSEMPEFARGSFLDAIGETLGVTGSGTSSKRFKVLAKQIEDQFSEPERTRIYRGFGRGVGWRFGADPYKSADQIVRIDRRYRDQASLGLRDFERFLARY